MKFGNRMRAGLFLLFVLLPNACADSYKGPLSKPVLGSEH